MKSNENGSARRAILASGREEGGVGHAERAEDPRAQHVAEPRALDDLDDPPEHVGRDAVLPRRSRLMHERQGGDRLDAFRRRPVGIEHAGRLGQLLHRPVAGETVGQARGVPQEVLHGDRALERLKRELVAARNPHLRIGEGGDIDRDWDR